jgi:hypothetical protein
MVCNAGCIGSYWVTYKPKFSILLRQCCMKQGMIIWQYTYNCACVIYCKQGGGGGVAGKSCGRSLFVTVLYQSYNKHHCRFLPICPTCIKKEQVIKQKVHENS